MLGRKFGIDEGGMHLGQNCLHEGYLGVNAGGISEAFVQRICGFIYIYIYIYICCMFISASEKKR